MDLSKPWRSANKLINRGPDEFEQQLRKHAIYTADELTTAPIAKLLKGKTLEFIGSGLNARVFKLKDSDWVIKEGKWDVKVDITFIKLPLPAVLLEKVAGLFKFVFLPRQKVISQQYRDYIAFAGYFGYFPNDQVYSHPQREMIFNLQRNIRNSLIDYVPHVEHTYQIKIPNKVLEILSSDIRFHNFLPQEYLLMGTSLSPENQGKPTYFIVQKFIKGKLMHDVDLSQVNGKLRQQLILFAYLELLMNAQVEMIPDTRPRSPLESFNWLTKTDNIIVTEKAGLVFIDTRWMWRIRSNLIARGFIIPELAINQAKELLLEPPFSL